MSGSDVEEATISLRMKAEAAKAIDRLQIAGSMPDKRLAEARHAIQKTRRAMDTHKYPFIAGVITGCTEAAVNYPV